MSMKFHFLLLCIAIQQAANALFCNKLFDHIRYTKVSIVDRSTMDSVKANISLLSPIQQEAVNHCDKIINKNSVVHRENHCVGRLMLTARVNKVKIIQDLHALFLSENPILNNYQRMVMMRQVMFYGMTYAYDSYRPGGLIHDSNEQAVSPHRTVCMLGEVDLRSVFVAGCSGYKTTVVFVEEFVEVFDMLAIDYAKKILNCKDSCDTSIEVKSMDDLLSDISSLHQGCDTIHVSGGSIIDALRIASFLDAYNEVHVNPTLLVWESFLNFSKTDLRYNMLHDSHEYIRGDAKISSLIRWEGRVSWATNSLLEYPDNEEGIHVKQTGMFVGFENNFADVWFGSLVRRDFSKIALDSYHYSYEEFRRKVRFIISYSGEVFAENAVGFKLAITKLGYKAVIMPDVNLLELMQIKFESSSTENSDGDNDGNVLIQLVFGVFEPTFLLPNYIVFESEQICWLSQETSLFHITALSRARRVLSFSTNQKAYLENHGIDKVGVVPFYSFINNITSSHSLGLQQHPIDILYYGGQSPRRARLWPDLLPTLDEDINFQFYTGAVGNYIKDEERDRVVSSSKVIINFHGCEPSSLALHRINYLLGMGKCVVSERSRSDPELDAEYEDSIVFVDNILDIFRVASYYVRHDLEREKVEIRAKMKFQSMESNLTALSENLDVVISQLFSESMLLAVAD